MGLGFRAVFAASISLLTAIACMGGENQCLNPHPELPSCRSNEAPGSYGGTLGAAAGASSGNGGPSAGAGLPPMGSGGRSASGDVDAGPPTPGEAGASDLGGAAGDSAIGGAGTGGEGGEGGAGLSR